VTSELDVLKIVSQRLDAAGVAYMLTGSFAMAYYTTPRKTRDLDIVVLLPAKDVTALATQFSKDFNADVEAVRNASRSEGFFNVMHLASATKVNFIVCKSAEYRRAELERRRRVNLGGAECWIVSREDLILSKLVWARETGSEQQQRDVRALLDDTVDWRYLQRWARELGVEDGLKSLPQGSDSTGA